MGRIKQLRSAVLGFVILSSLTVWPAFAATITVTNTNDSGAGSLRDAIANASSGDTINFNIPNYPATITLSTFLSVNTNLTISGPGASNLAISGNDSVQVVQIASGITVSISGLTIEHGFASVEVVGAGGISNLGTLTVTNSTVSSNSGFYGSGFYNAGTLRVINSNIRGNGNCCGQGGGILSYGSVLLINTTVSDNIDEFTAGISGPSGTVSLINSTVSGNKFTGISAATVLLINSTVSGNTNAEAGPGGIWGDTVTLINSTVSGNSGFGVGGISGNEVTMKNTVFADNRDFSFDQQHDNCSPTSLWSSYGHNLSDDDSCSSFLTAAGDLNNVPAGLDPGGLKNNGGPTQTVALLPTSPAVNAIPSNYCTAVDGTTPIATDQRGLPRAEGSGCDIGAFEYLAITAPAPTSGSTCNGAYNGTFKGNLTISPGQNCVFFDGAVTGNVQQYGGSFILFQSEAGKNVQVNGGGTFSIGPGSTINGNLEVQNLPNSSGQNQVCGSTVVGNLNVQNNGTAVLIGANPPSGCVGNTVDGNVQVQNNWASTSLVGNTVVGNLSDQNNTAATQVFGNAVSGNLNCQNDTAIQGGGNTAGKQKQGQCSGF